MNKFNTNIPIYLQVVDMIKNQIMNGTLQPGDKISSVRELAQELSVNPNTIQKAFGELEREGFIRTERAVGRYVTDHLDLIEEYKMKQVKDNIKDFVKQMELLGISIDNIMEYLKEYKEVQNNGCIDSN